MHSLTFLQTRVPSASALHRKEHVADDIKHQFQQLLGCSGSAHAAQAQLATFLMIEQLERVVGEHAANGFINCVAAKYGLRESEEQVRCELCMCSP